MTGKNKKMNFNKIKTIKITEEQEQNWNPNEIRNLLDGNTNENSIDTSILMKMIPAFIEYGIKLTTTTELEDKRIMELIEKCL